MSKWIACEIAVSIAVPIAPLGDSHQPNAEEGLISTL